ncbi:unnamed protein product [Adineta ricciae]|uniref:Uncharacterized protein n=1 Tax=Adineta ricciae TaxID=249248 RepID=A0A813MUP2_ADIRI|nr:unnamed protein product [Adineta ricciae]
MPQIVHELSFKRFLDSLKLTPKYRLVEFGGTHMGRNISLVLHDFHCCSLRRYDNRYSGIITPIVPSALTTALLSAIFYAASVEIKPFFCFLLGVGQTGVILFFSFLKILSTL